MATAKSINELKIQFQKIANKVLEENVLPRVAGEAGAQGITTVYSHYYMPDTHAPKVYARRELGGGGLLDPSSFDGEVAAGVLSVRNIAQANPNYPGKYRVTDLALLVEYGHGNGGRYSYGPAKGSVGDFRPPRPLMADTIERLRKNGAHIDAFKEGFNNAGQRIV